VIGLELVRIYDGVVVEIADSCVRDVVEVVADDGAGRWKAHERRPLFQRLVRYDAKPVRR
jgi:hypothetical protein